MLGASGSLYTVAIVSSVKFVVQAVTQKSALFLAKLIAGRATITPVPKCQPVSVLKSWGNRLTSVGPYSKLSEYVTDSAMESAKCDLTRKAVLWICLFTVWVLFDLFVCLGLV